MAYSYKRSITVDHTKVGSSDLTDFPVLVSGTYSWLATASNGGRIQNSGCFDLGFTSDSAGLTPLYWEIDSYNPTTGKIAVWVRVPSLSHTVDTPFYAWYGDSSITTFQSTVTSVWDSNFMAVTHYGDSSGLTANDSTINANHGVVSGITAGDGKIGKAGVFDGSNSHFVRLPISTSLRLSGAFTLEGWINTTTFNTYQAMMARSSSSSNRDYAFFLGPSVGQVNSIGYVYVAIGNFNDGPNIPSTAWQTNVWNHFALTYNGLLGAYKVYLNGLQVYTNPFWNANPTNFGGDVYYGNELGSAFTIFGMMDENRISNSLRSADWILAGYNNQNDPASFYTVGSEVAVGQAIQQPIIFIGT